MRLVILSGCMIYPPSQDLLRAKRKPLIFCQLKYEQGQPHTHGERLLKVDHTEVKGREQRMKSRKQNTDPRVKQMGIST